MIRFIIWILILIVLVSNFGKIIDIGGAVVDRCYEWVVKADSANVVKPIPIEDGQ